MSKKRFLAPWRREAVDLKKFRTRGGMEKYLRSLHGKPAIYHCVSRIVDRRQVLGAEEKEHFVHLMRAYEEFCMVRVLTFCVMSNHFHILVEIPEAPGDRGKSWSDEKFLKHLSCYYYGDRYRGIEQELKWLREQKRDNEAVALRDRFFVRMWDLSSFIQGIKQRFTRWFNKCNDRDGVLWSERFKSVLVESGRAARTVGAYIDLNPVRAGMIEDPKDYRWCGYGEAVAGIRRAREGLRLIVLEEMMAHLGDQLGAKAAASWRDVAGQYRKNLFMDGEKSRKDEKKGRAGISSEKASEVFRKDGKLSEAEMLRHRMRHFTDGLVIGNESFVEGAFALARDYFSPSRQSGARRIRRVDTPLCSMRDLRKDPVNA